MPAGLTAVRSLEDVVFFPVRLRTKRFPRRRIKRWTIDTPAAIWQILIIQLAVVLIHRRLQRTDRIKALHDLIAARSTGRFVSETNARRVSAFEVFPLMTNLSLHCRCARSISRRRHAQDLIPGLIRIFYERTAVVPPDRPRHAGPACFRANDPAVLL